MRSRFSVLLVVVILVGLGMGAGAGAIQARMGKEANGGATTARQQSSTGQSAPAGVQSSDGTTPAQQGSFGTIESVSASGFVLVAQNSRIQVAITGSTAVTKMADIKAADLNAGDSIIATGTLQADGSFAATSIQVGTADTLRGMAGGRIGPASQQDGQSGGSGVRPQATQRAGQPGAGGMQGIRGSTVVGTVEAVEGAIVSVKTQAGSVSKLAVSGSTTVRKSAAGSLSDIQAGQSAMVSGERKSDGTITATSVQLTPAGR